jgi:flagellin-like hook-associated protein FlgL
MAAGPAYASSTRIGSGVEYVRAPRRLCESDPCRRINFGPVTLAKLISESSASADKKFAALAGDISDIKSTMATKADLAEAVDKLDDRLSAIESKIGGIHNRIDDESLKRANLETRVRSVLPNLPPPPERV